MSLHKDQSIDVTAEFERTVTNNIASLRSDQVLATQSTDWLLQTLPHHYSYNFRWLGRPLIQYPQDIVAVQELIWQIKPDLIIETGIAHGGSLILSASMLALLDYCDAVEADTLLAPKPRAAVCWASTLIFVHTTVPPSKLTPWLIVLT